MATVTKVAFLIINLFILNTCHAEIKMIQATIRHGDRYPEDKESLLVSYPNDPYFNHTWAPYGKMELTEKGISNAFKMGQFLRKSYGELLGSTYNSNEVYFRSTDTNRTIATGRWVAAGLYSNSLVKNWNSILSSINVSIYTVPYHEDTLNNALYLCENYFIDRQESEKKLQEENFIVLQQIFDYLSDHTGIRHSRSTQGFTLYHNFVAQSNLGLQTEPWVVSVFPNGQLWNISVIEYKLQSYTDRMKRLTGGIWIRTFLDHVDNLINNTDKRKAYFYINHETHTAAILNTLGVYKPHIPSYLSTIIFELHEDGKNLYVKVIHKNENVLTELVIPGCPKSLCLLKTFKTVLENVTLENFDKDCGERQFYDYFTESSSSTKLENDKKF